MTRLFLSLSLSLCGIVSAALPGLAVEMKDLPPSVSVTGEGHAFAKPDQAQISMGVVSDAKTAAVALKNNTDKMNSLMSTLKSKGIAEKDILTSNFSVNPQYRYDNINGQQRPSIVGYQVSNEVHVKIRNLPTLGDILDAVITAGANNVNGISFSLAEPDSVLDQARQKAMADAKRKAELYAGAAGVKVGRVLYITESSGTIQPPRPMMMATRAEMAQSVPIAAGEQESTAAITVVYAIE
ncbi:MAG: SIMPL domain-containing protein [Candidatus Obscuribacterales bacterium]